MMFTHLPPLDVSSDGNEALSLKCFLSVLVLLCTKKFKTRQLSESAYHREIHENCCKNNKDYFQSNFSDKSISYCKAQFDVLYSIIKKQNNMFPSWIPMLPTGFDDLFLAVFPHGIKLYIVQCTLHIDNVYFMLESLIKMAQHYFNNRRNIIESSILSTDMITMLLTKVPLHFMLMIATGG